MKLRETKQPVEHGDADEFDGLAWPDLMLTPRASKYTGCSTWSLLRAARAGSLPIAGRRGKTYVFRKIDLDRWLLGVEPDESKPLAPVVPITSAKFRRPLGESLARVRAAAGREDK